MEQDAFGDCGIAITVWRIMPTFQYTKCTYIAGDKDFSFLLDLLFQESYEKSSKSKIFFVCVSICENGMPSLLLARCHTRHLQLLADTTVGTIKKFNQNVLLWKVRAGFTCKYPSYWYLWLPWVCSRFGICFSCCI